MKPLYARLAVLAKSDFSTNMIGDKQAYGELRQEEHEIVPKHVKLGHLISVLKAKCWFFVSYTLSNGKLKVQIIIKLREVGLRDSLLRWHCPMGLQVLQQIMTSGARANMHLNLLALKKLVIMLIVGDI
ncbi:hypothetical protein LINGRAHAP2_LOCUS9961 [Linum grandiflorum]